MMRRVSASVLAALFGLVLIAAGREVYNIGTEKLEGASEEECRVLHKERRNCTYACGGMFSPAEKCTGFSYVYSSVSPEKCSSRVSTFDERAVLHELNVSMCRCGDRQPPGDCWVEDGYAANKTYPCTVADSCRSFDFVVPSEIKKTGAVNVAFGVSFLLFACCPNAFIDGLYFVVEAVVSFLAFKIIVPVAQFAYTWSVAWLKWVHNYAAAPARDLDEESYPLFY